MSMRPMVMRTSYLAKAFLPGSTRRSVLVQTARRRNHEIILGLAASGLLASGLGGVAPAVAGDWKVARNPHLEYRVIPRLEVKLFSGDFEQWSIESVLYQPTLLTLRWGSPLSGRSATWELAAEPFPTNNVLATGTVTIPSQSPAKWCYFQVDLREWLPSTPPTHGAMEYYVHIVPEEGPASSAIKITYKRDESSTRFTAAGLYPELFRPMPIVIDLDTFHIIKADEEDDEEPYLVPIVLYMDGESIDATDLPSSTVRIQTSSRREVHENIPQYNGSIGSGDQITIPDDVGRFESAIRPISMDLADNPVAEAFLGFPIDYSHLTNASTVWVAVLALEEDGTTSESAETLRDVFVDALAAELNRCIQSLQTDDVRRLLINGQNVEEILTADDTEICGYTATEDSSVLDQIRAKLRKMAKDAAKSEELDDAIHWLPGGITNLLDSLDHDDVIGFGYRSFTYDELWHAKRPIPLRFDLHKLEGPQAPSAGLTNVQYEVRGSIGRCQHIPGKANCVPVVEIDWASGR
jgi:hypothetical protein